MLSNLRTIFGLYGGWKALRSSSYLFTSVALSLLLWRSSLEGSWAKDVEDYLPPILGFSIAALAIIMTIGNDQFRQKMAKIDVLNPGESDLTVVVASFCWFIFVQISAILLSIIFAHKPFPNACLFPKSCFDCDSWNISINYAAGFIGNFLLVYSILLMFAAVVQMLNLYRLYLRNV